MHWIDCKKISSKLSNNPKQIYSNPRNASLTLELLLILAMERMYAVLQGTLKGHCHSNNFCSKLNVNSLWTVDCWMKPNYLQILSRDSEIHLIDCG